MHGLLECAKATREEGRATTTATTECYVYTTGSAHIETTMSYSLLK